MQTPLVYISCGHDEIALFDVAAGRCHQVLRLSEHIEGGAAVPAALQGPRAAPDAASRSAALDEHLRLPQLRNPAPGVSGYGGVDAVYNCQQDHGACRALALMASGAGPVLSAGTDRCIRLWEPLRPELSYVVCGPPSDDPLVYRKRLFQNVPVIDELRCPAASGVGEVKADAPTRRVAAVRGGALCHQDAITALGEAWTTDRVLLSGSRDGVVSVWR